MRTKPSSGRGIYPRFNAVADQDCVKSRTLPLASGATHTEVTFGVSFHASASRMCVDRLCVLSCVHGRWFERIRLLLDRLDYRRLNSGLRLPLHSEVLVACSVELRRKHLRTSTMT